MDSIRESGKLDPMSSLPESVRNRVQTHPCFSEQAHHHFARIHLAVAPACNIQCHYCNRKYDCANESRPGVVSELLTPEQAVKKTLAVAAAIPQLAVVGIAGPGDPLANPECTLETFRELSEKAPDLKLCVSTNGLMLPQYVDELVKHNIGHVTITINCIDPDIGAKIYPWISWNRRRVRGREAAQILIEQQQKGLEMLVERDILVKVNSVMIPGVNDQHLIEVNRVVKGKGAFVHNIMPLISKAEHGTYYGRIGLRGPTHQQLEELRKACGEEMKMMRHCHQCRSDAVGKLGQDRSSEFTMEKIEAMQIDHQAAIEKRATVRADILRKLEKPTRKLPSQVLTAPLAKIEADQEKPTRAVMMAVASRGGKLIDEHFGHAREFLIYEATGSEARFIERREVGLYCKGSSECGDAETVMHDIIRTLERCEVLLCGRIGYEPWKKLEMAGIQPNSEHAMESIEEAVLAVYRELAGSGKLDDSTDAFETSQARA